MRCSIVMFVSFSYQIELNIQPEFEEDNFFFFFSLEKLSFGFFYLIFRRAKKRRLW
jgi:hypothetical protein